MSEARSMSFNPDYTACINRNVRLSKMQKKLDAKVVTMHNKKIRQLPIYIEKFGVCRFIQTAYSLLVGEGRRAGTT